MTPTEKLLLVEGAVAVILLFTGVATGYAAWATKRSAEATEENTRGELLARLSLEFWSREFGEACDQLGHFVERDDFVDQFDEWRGARTPWATQTDPWVEQYDRLKAARRLIKGYYHTVYRLQRTDHFNCEEVRDLLTSRANTRLLLTGVESLETVVTEDYDPEDDGDLYEFYHELYNGELPRPVVEEA